MAVLDWTELGTNDFPSLDRQRTLAVLPLGAVEQHGPHLPTGTDSHILAALLARLRGARLRGGTALLLPQQPVGLSTEHTNFPGTLTIGAETLLAAWVDLGACVARAGIDRLVLLTSHGGNGALAELAALRLRERFGLVAVSLVTHRLGVPEGMVDPLEQRFGVHAGQIETALMQAIAPDKVDRAARTDFASDEPAIVARADGLGAAG
ncbi:MAG: creatininase family protein, partial [Planctomycetota bacterium]